MSRNLISNIPTESAEGKNPTHSDTPLPPVNMLIHPGETPRWLVFLAYLAYLRAMRPHPPAGVTVLRLLVMVVGIVLVVVALVAAGAPDQVTEALKAWPIVP